MLKISGLIKSYRVRDKTVYAVNNVTCEIDFGQMVLIYGNSGSGKSTFLNMIAGLDRPDSGEVVWDSDHITQFNPSESADFRLNNCGIIFQSFELIKTQNVFSNAALPLKLLKTDKKRIKEILLPLFERYQIETLFEKKPPQLSGGEKQRAAIIRALSGSPRFIIADEITASLDSEMSRRVYADLRDYIKKQQGLGIFVSHDPIIRDYADRVYRMHEGRLDQE
jgi:putative ABC transport system ATP-binding protein